MTLAQIQTVLAGIDSDIRHYFSAAQGDAYTYWEESQRLPFKADDVHPTGDEAWRFYVHRFTKSAGDPMASEIFDELDEHAGIAVAWTVDFEQDTGYIHHIFECEAY